MKKNRFFAKHAKSSAIVLSLILHAALLVAAFVIIAVQVVLPEDPGFIGVLHEQKPRIIKYIPKPVHVNRRTTPRPSLKPVTIKPVRLKPTALVIPTIAAIHTPPGLEQSSDMEGLVCNLGSDLRFIGDMTQKGEKVVFLVHAGPATTGGKAQKQSPHSRMTFYTIRTRLNELVDELPAYTLFNVAFYWAGHTTPLAPGMLPASNANKQMMKDWG